MRLRYFISMGLDPEPYIPVYFYLCPRFTCVRTAKNWGTGIFFAFYFYFLRNMWAVPERARPELSKTVLRFWNRFFFLFLWDLQHRSTFKKKRILTGKNWGNSPRWCCCFFCWRNLFSVPERALPAVSKTVLRFSHRLFFIFLCARTSGCCSSKCGSFFILLLKLGTHVSIKVR